MNIDIMVGAKILSNRTPVAHQLSGIIGQTLPVSGNAYDGFEIILPNGERRNLYHYTYEPVLKKHKQIAYDDFCDMLGIRAYDDGAELGASLALYEHYEEVNANHGIG